MISPPDMHLRACADEPEMWWFEWGFEEGAKISVSPHAHSHRHTYRYRRNDTTHMERNMHPFRDTFAETDTDTGKGRHTHTRKGGRGEGEVAPNHTRCEVFEMLRKLVLISFLSVVSEESSTYLWASFLVSFCAQVIAFDA